MSKKECNMSAKEFTMKLLHGMAIGIVVALIPNAVLSAILKNFAYNETVKLFLDSLVIMQGLVGAIIGFLVSLQFNINPMKSSIIAGAALISSGVIKSTPHGFVMKGIGDLINVILFTAIAVLITMWLDNKLGSVTIVLQPIIVGTGVGFLGLLCLPYVSKITYTIGQIVQTFTTLQPLLMSILIAISFAIIIISPISTVAIGIATGLMGLSSGAANIGVVATTAVLIIGSFRINKSGVTLAVFLGAMKMMLPNIVRYPIMYLPIVITAICSGIGVRILGISGTPFSAGFGIVGMIGPIGAYKYFVKMGVSMPYIRLLIGYVIIPFGVAFICHILFTKILKIYSKDIYKFD